MQPGSVIDGRFRLEASIGRGGLGEVFRAVDLRDGAPCAVKLMRAHVAREPRVRRRFLREARAVSRLSHPHIVRLLAVGGQEGTPYLAMELLEGQPLTAFREGEAPLGLVLRLVDQCLAALAYSHARGVIHRDFKPDNVLVVPGPEGPVAKLLDFGFARVEEDDDPDLTQVHRDAFGTPDYMAPEQANGEGPVGPPTDLYAVGAVLFELLSGRPPFSGPTAMAVVFKQIMEATPPLVPRPGFEVSPALEAVVARALAKAPRDRFQTANELRRALAQAQGQDWEAPALAPARQETRQIGPAALARVAAAAEEPGGRGPELDWLWAQVHAACTRGAGRVLLLGGAAGLGRHALLRWLADEVAEGGWMQVLRSAPGGGSQLGHAAVREGLEQLFGGLPPGREGTQAGVEAAVAGWQAHQPEAAVAGLVQRAALGVLADYLRPADAEDGLPVPGPVLRARVVEALRLAAAARPVLWLVEEGERAGPALLGVLEGLAEALAARGGRVLVVVSFATDGVGPARERLAALARRPGAERRVLAPLAAEVLAGILAARGLAGALAAQLAEAAAGNLRQAELLWALLAQRGALVEGPEGLALAPGEDPGRWPVGLAAVAQAQLLGVLEGLPDAAHARRTLLSAAILGNSFDYGLLVDFMARSGAEGPRTEAAIEALLAAGALEDVQDWRVDRLQFPAGGLTAAEAAGAAAGLPLAPLHRLAAEVKQHWQGATGGEALASELAAHYRAAGAVFEAAGQLEISARRAQAAGELGAATAQLEEAAALLGRREGPEADRRRAMVALARAELALAQGQLKAARALAGEAEAAARALRDGRIAGLVRGVVARLMAETGQPEAAIRLYEQAQRLLEREGASEPLALARLAQAGLAEGLGQERLAQEGFEAARAALLELARFAPAAQAALGLGRLAARQGAAARAQGLLEQALDGFARAGDRAGQARAHLALAEVAAKRDAPALEEAHLAEALAQCAAVGDGAGQAQAHLWRAVRAARAGLPAAAEELAAAVALRAAAGDEGGVVEALRAVGRAWLLAGDAVRAAAPLAEALDRLGPAADPGADAALSALAGWAAGAVGDDEGYRRLLRRAWQRSRLPEGQADPDLPLAFEGAGQVAAQRGDLRAGARLLRRAATLQARAGDPAEASRLQALADRLVGPGDTGGPEPVAPPDTSPPLIPPPPLSTADTREQALKAAWASPGPLSSLEAQRLAESAERPPALEEAEEEDPGELSVGVASVVAQPTRVAGTTGPPREPGADPVVGRHIGNLRIVAPIASGGMGTVYKALHTVLNIPYAVKLLHQGFADDPNTLARFRREAVACSRLRHPNVVFLTDFGLDPKLGLYLVMEFLEGEPLSARLRREGAVPVGEAVDFALQISRALSLAHGMGVVHRDLKPENLFLVPDGAGGIRVKVLDFGIARLNRLHAEDADHPKLTRAGLVLGTPDYMAPEQINGKDELLGPPTDIYALGALLYQMVCGQPPFSGANEFKVLSQHLLNAAPRLASHRPELAGGALEALVADMLHKTPAGRPADMDAVGARLEEALRELRAQGVPGAGQALRAQPAREASLLGRLRGLDPEGSLAQVIGALPGLTELPLARQQLVLWGVLQRVALDSGLGTRSFQGACAQLAELLEVALTAGHEEGDEASRELASRALADVLERAEPARQKPLVLAVQRLRARPGFPEPALPGWARVSAAPAGSFPEAGRAGLVPAPAGARRAEREALSGDPSLFGRPGR